MKTDRKMDMKKLIDCLHNYANVPKNSTWKWDGITFISYNTL
jgi:hypothetical protein